MTTARLKLDGIALGTSRVSAGSSVAFMYAVQRCLSIQSLFLAPADEALEPGDLTIIWHEPESAKIQRFADGYTISDEGIRRATYTMERETETPFAHRLRPPTIEQARITHNASRWFIQEGISYLRVEVAARVCVRVHNRSDRAVDALTLLLCLPGIHEAH